VKLSSHVVAFRRVCCFAAAAMYQEKVPSYKHLDEPLDEGRFVFECILAGNLQAFTKCRLHSHVQETVLLICLA